MADVSAPNSAANAAIATQIAQQQSTQVQTPVIPADVGYNPNDVKSHFTTETPGQTPGRFANVLMGQDNADVNASMMSAQVDQAFSSQASVQAAMTKKNEIELKTGDATKKFSWKGDGDPPPSVSHDIHNWLDQQGVPKDQRNFKIDHLKADDFKSTMNALGPAHHVSIGQIDNSSGKLDVDQAHFAHVDANGKAVFERNDTQIKIGKIGDKLSSLSLSGTDKNDTLFSRWSGASTTIDGKQGNDILAGIGNGKSTYTIKDEGGKNFIALLNGKSGSEIKTTGGVNTIKLQSDAKTKIESKGQDTITLGGAGKADVHAEGPSATVTQDVTSGVNYKKDDFDVSKKTAFTFIKRSEVNDPSTNQRGVVSDTVYEQPGKAPHNPPPPPPHPGENRYYQAPPVPGGPQDHASATASSPQPRYYQGPGPQPPPGPFSQVTSTLSSPQFWVGIGIGATVTSLSQNYNDYHSHSSHSNYHTHSSNNHSHPPLPPPPPFLPFPSSFNFSFASHP